MKKRLVATGLLKDDEKEVNPEQLINLDERILLNHKSTPGRTYKAFFQNPDGKETLLEYTDVGNLDELYTSLRFFISYGSEVVEPFWSFDQYFDFIAVLLFATGLAFQVPAIQVVLGLLNIVTGKRE